VREWRVADVDLALARHADDLVAGNAHLRPRARLELEASLTPLDERLAEEGQVELRVLWVRRDRMGEDGDGHLRSWPERRLREARPGEHDEEEHGEDTDRDPTHGSASFISGAKFRNSGPGAYAAPFPMSNAMGAHSTRPWARAVASESVQAGAVVPEDPSLVLFGERELEEMRGGLGVLRGLVRIVGGADEAGAGAAVHGVSRRLLVAFDGDEALTDEVLARPLGDRWILEAPRILPVLVETPEPEGQPGPVAFEEGHLQSWEAGQHPAERHRLHGQHLLHAVRARVLECERVVAEAIRPHRGHARGHALVEAERHAEVLDRRPERIEDRLVPVDSGARRVRSEKDRLEAQLHHRAARLADRQGDVLDREHGRSVHPPGIAGLAEVGQPVVVGPRDRG